ncbi:Thymidine kinase, cytosolic-like [Oopsacas minuta]|uniref:Thymidine kinase n=1 Tax=Oopsacas minuta TaxID=111878 RepID=A0AAV7JMR8_9METZ|nr:Thymidine kinase, cytosolic-like [Oopsacas minuta]
MRPSYDSPHRKHSMDVFGEDEELFRTPPRISWKKYGYIQVIMGPMFSGKTTELLRRVKRYSIATYKSCLVKYKNDTRYDQDNIATHDKELANAISCTKLADIYDQLKENQVIGIDEGQFMEDLVEFCEKLANEGKIVIVACLDGTFQRKSFAPIPHLIPLAESVIKLKAVCMKCYADASFTKRTVESQKVELIGGADKYMAVCRACYFEV